MFSRYWKRSQSSSERFVTPPLAPTPTPSTPLITHAALMSPSPIHEEYHTLDAALFTTPEDMTAPRAPSKPPGMVSIPEGDGSPKFSFRKLWAYSGPGLLMSIAYLDPGNIEGDLQAGAVAGYKLLGILFWSTACGFLLQSASLKLGVVTGKHLAEMCRLQYSRPIRLVLWIMIELAVIGADIQEVIGSAIAIHIISQQKIPLWGGALITGVDTFTFLALERYGMRKLELAFALMIAVMVVTFGYIFQDANPDSGEIAKGIFLPTIPRSAVPQAVGMIGAVIMPHNLFLHSALVLSRDVDKKNKAKVKEATMYFNIEAGLALIVSFVINMFIMSVFAYTFHDNPKYPHPTDIDLSNAGYELSDIYGKAVLYIWAVGLLAAGQSSTITETYTGQFILQGFFGLQLYTWQRVLVTRIASILPTVLVAALAVQYLNTMDAAINVVQCIQLPFALIPLLHFTNSPGIMGDFANNRLTKAVLLTLSLAVVAANMYLIFVLFETFPNKWWVYFLTAIGVAIYAAFTLYMALGPYLPFGSMRHIVTPNAAVGYRDRRSADVINDLDSSRNSSPLLITPTPAA